MAREKDEAKRSAILAAAKRLFAERGYHGTSVSDMARETGLPVGSIYTYFPTKDAVFASVIEEGWEDFLQGLSAALGAAPSPEGKIAYIVQTALPALFRDVDLISILVGEAGRGELGSLSAGLEEKLERLASLVSEVIAELAASRGLDLEFPPARARAAIGVYFLGSLYTVRLSRAAGLKIGEAEILDFIRLSVENAFGIRL